MVQLKEHGADKDDVFDFDGPVEGNVSFWLEQAIECGYRFIGMAGYAAYLQNDKNNMLLEIQEVM